MTIPTKMVTHVPLALSITVITTCYLLDTGLPQNISSTQAECLAPQF